MTEQQQTFSETEAPKTSTAVCPVCGKEFTCKCKEMLAMFNNTDAFLTASYKIEDLCWCAYEPPLSVEQSASIEKKYPGACLCKQCLTKVRA